jgi:hypothetical protein
MSHPYQSIQAPVSQATGTGTIVAAVAGARIRVMSAVLSVGTAGTPFNFQSHATVANKTNAIQIGADSLVLPYNPDGWFVTSLGEALDIVVGGTAQTVTGTINYVTL